MVQFRGVSHATAIRTLANLLLLALGLALLASTGSCIRVLTPDGSGSIKPDSDLDVSAAIESLKAQGIEPEVIAAQADFLNSLGEFISKNNGSLPSTLDQEAAIPGLAHPQPLDAAAGNDTEGRSTLQRQPCTHRSIKVVVGRLACFDDSGTAIYGVSINNLCNSDVTSPFRFWGCFKWPDIEALTNRRAPWFLKNPARNPTRFQKDSVFKAETVPYFEGICQLRYNDGPSGNIQLPARTTRRFIYIGNMPIRLCAHEVRWANGDVAPAPRNNNEWMKTCVPAPTAHAVAHCP